MAKKHKPGQEAADADKNTDGADSVAKTSVPGPSPSPITNLILADIALRAGGALLRRGVERGLLGNAVGAARARKIVRGRTLTETLFGTALARVATRSVPGAIVVGGGLLAKTLYDRRHARKSHAEGEKALAKQAEKGDED